MDYGTIRPLSPMVQLPYSLHYRFANHFHYAQSR